MSRLATVVIAALVLAVSAACSTTQSASTQLSDAAITNNVKAKLVADPEINPFQIDVDTDDGIVRLSGVVHRDDQRTEAEKLARQAKGVRDVINDLTVGDKNFEEGASDSWIGSKVKAKLISDPEVNGFNIDVDVELGVVTLSGTVKSPGQRVEAEKLARNTKGVREVRNLIKVKGE